MLVGYVELQEQLADVTNKLAIYANLRYSANTKDTEAASVLGRIMGAKPVILDILL